MNIIELFEKLSIDKSNISGLTQEEIIRIEKQVNVERRINPDIEVNVATNLIDALKNHPNEFQFVVNTRILYNFFAKKSYFRDSFPKDNIEINYEDVRHFIGLYLVDELMLFFDKKLIDNSFEEMNDYLEYKNYFPEDLLYKIAKKAEGKLDFALSKLYAKEQNYAPILYIKQENFYHFLSHFSTLELDEKVKSLLNVIVDIYNVSKSSDFAGTTMVSMSSYAAFDDDLEETLASNKKVVLDNKAGRYEKEEKSKSGFSWKTFAVVLFILIRVAFFANKCSSDDRGSSDYDNVNYDNYETPSGVGEQVLDRYYVEAQPKIDTFQMFLVDYNKYKLRNVTYNDSIKTGQNPFETFYKQQFVSTSDNFMKFENKTNYDVILMENAVAFDTINTAKQAYFIKAKQTFKLDLTSNYNRSFYFYVGKRLGSFHNENEKLYVRLGSIVEPRFTELAKNSKELLRETFRFTNDVQIIEKNGVISINSDNKSENEKSFKEIAKEQEVIIEELKKEKE